LVRRLERLVEVAGGDTAEVQVRDQGVEGLRPPDVPRQEHRLEGLPLALRPAVVDPGLADWHGAESRLDGPLRLAAIADDQAVALVIQDIRPLGDPGIDLGLDGVGQEAACPLPEDVRQDVRGSGGWKRDRIGGSVGHGGVSLCLVVLAQGTPPSFCAELIHNFWSCPIGLLGR